MRLISDMGSFITKSKWTVLLFFIALTLPLFILTFDTANWSDDYQLTNMIVLKARFSPVIPMCFELVSGLKESDHFVPVYMLINYLLASVTTDPRFFHFVILVVYVLTGFLLHLIVEEYHKDKTLAVATGALYLINYYLNFKAIAWNCFHGHSTNVFLGATSVYFLLRHLNG